MQIQLLTLTANETAQRRTFVVLMKVLLSLDDCRTECKRPHNCDQLLDTSDVLVFGIQREAVTEFCTQTPHRMTNQTFVMELIVNDIK